MPRCTNPLNLPPILSQGWTVCMFLFLMMSVTQLVLAAGRNDWAEFATHPGPRAWAVLSVVVTLYAAMSMLVHLVRAGWFRWLNVALAAAATLNMMAHHLHHTLSRSGAAGWFQVFDFAHHAVGVCMTVLAVRWALATRRGEPQ